MANDNNYRNPDFVEMMLRKSKEKPTTRVSSPLGNLNVKEIENLTKDVLGSRKKISK